MINLENAKALQKLNDKLNDNDKQKLLDLLERPILLAILTKQMSMTLKTSVSVIQHKTEFEQNIAQKILATCDTLDNLATIIDTLIKNENEKFLTDSKRVKKIENIESKKLEETTESIKTTE